MTPIRNFITLLLFAICASGMAQPVAHFSEIRHDFGSITWKMSAMTTFSVKNEGNSPLIIENVHPDCGCTVVNWTKLPIAPGEAGKILATYNAELLGSFRKQIAVHTNAAERPVYLTLTGEVVEHKTEYTGDFPCQIGDLYLSTDNIEFDDVSKGDYPEKTILVYNNGKKPYRSELMHLPKYIVPIYEPEIINSGKVGKITLRLISDRLPDMGLTQTGIYLSRFPGDRVNKETEINISATLLPEAVISKTQLAYAPKLVLERTNIDMGSMGSKKSLKTSIYLTNEGKTNLEIKKLQVYNPGISVRCGKSVLKPGERTRLRITLNATSNYFKGSRRILLITNDPKNPKTVIDIAVKK